MHFCLTLDSELCLFLRMVLEGSINRYCIPSKLVFWSIGCRQCAHLLKAQVEGETHVSLSLSVCGVGVRVGSIDPYSPSHWQGY